MSEDDRTITDDGSLVDYRGQSDRRYHTSNRTVHVYDKSFRPSGRQRTYRALYDYDPYKSSGSEHPERELHLKEGDYITVYGEMDVAGYLEAEVDGRSYKLEAFKQDISLTWSCHLLTFVTAYFLKS